MVVGGTYNMPRNKQVYSTNTIASRIVLSRTTLCVVWRPSRTGMPCAHAAHDVSPHPVTFFTHYCTLRSGERTPVSIVFRVAVRWGRTSAPLARFDDDGAGSERPCAPSRLACAATSGLRDANAPRWDMVAGGVAR